MFVPSLLVKTIYNTVSCNKNFMWSLKKSVNKRYFKTGFEMIAKIY